jgi:hypothetical protein
MWQGIHEETRESFIICESNVITMKLLWHSYLVHSLDCCVMKLYTESGITLCTQPYVKGNRSVLLTIFFRK